MSSDKLAQALRRIKSNLMHQRRFGVDDMGHWRRAAAQAEGDLEEALAAHEAEKQAGPVAGLPERDTEKPAEQQGVFRKFEVRRVDGSDAPGGKHHGCEYFVLDVDHDPCAPAALAAYADAAEATHPVLAQDMRQRYGLYTAPPSPLAEQDKVDAELMDAYAEGRGDQFEDDCAALADLFTELESVDAIGDGFINTTRVRELLTHFDMPGAIDCQGLECGRPDCDVSGCMANHINDERKRWRANESSKKPHAIRAARAKKEQP